MRLSGITRTLKGGCQLYAATEGFDVRVIILKSRDGETITCGKAATLTGALLLADRNCVGRYVRLLMAPRVLVGRHTSENYADRWLLQGHTFRAWSEAGLILIELYHSKKGTFRNLLGRNETRHGHTFDEALDNLNLPRGSKIPALRIV